MGYQWWDGALLIVDVSYVAPEVPTKLPINQLPKVSIAVFSILADRSKNNLQCSPHNC